jgi:hypothetical protein
MNRKSLKEIKYQICLLNLTLSLPAFLLLSLAQHLGLHDTQPFNTMQQRKGGVENLRHKINGRVVQDPKKVYSLKA